MHVLFRLRTMREVEADKVTGVEVADRLHTGSGLDCCRCQVRAQGLITCVNEAFLPVIGPFVHCDCAI